MSSSSRILKDITRTSIYKQLKEKFYYPYYLSGPKVETLFAQLWGDIKSYSRGSAKKISTEIGLQGKTTGILKWLAELAATARIGSGLEWNFTGNYDIPDLARLLVLRRFLEDNSRMKNLADLSPEERNTPHLFVEYFGSFTFSVEAEDANRNLSAASIQEINHRKNFEEKAERDPHFLFFIPDSKAVALVANRYFSHYGHRFLPHSSESRQINFFGSTIGEAAGLLFLDPIAIGYREIE